MIRGFQTRWSGGARAGDDGGARRRRLVTGRASDAPAAEAGETVDAGEPAGGGSFAAKRIKYYGSLGGDPL